MLKHLCGAALLGAGLALAATNANATIVTLTDPDNSTNTVVFDSATGKFTNWTVGGVEQLKAGNSGLFYHYGFFGEQQLGGDVTQNYTNSGTSIPTGCFANITYSKTGLYDVTLSMSLSSTGPAGDPSKSMLHVTGTVTNTSGAPLSNFAVLDFTDLDLNGTPTNDSLAFDPPAPSTSVTQTDGAEVGYDAAFAFQWKKAALGTDVNTDSLTFEFSKAIEFAATGGVADAKSAEFGTGDLSSENGLPDHQATTSDFSRNFGTETPVSLNGADTPLAPTTAIPEPATTLLSFLGLSALGTLSLRRRSAK